MHAPAWLDALRAELPDADPLAPQADIAIVWRPPPALFEEQRRLRAVFNLGASVDALLAMPAFPRDALLVRLEDAGMADALAEYVLAAVLRVYRGFDRYAIRRRDARWQPEVLRPRANFAVGVPGLGVIGMAIARALAAHGLAVRGFARTRHAMEGVDCSAGDAEIASFLDGLDVLASVLPLTPDNRGILNRANLARLADGAHLINVGRGAHLSKRICSRCSTQASSAGRRSTCSKPNRCRPTIRSGGGRRSSSRRTSPQ